MRSKWSGYGIAVWVAGFVLLAEGFVELLRPVVVEKIAIEWVQDNSRGLLLVFFAVVVLVMATCWRSEEHP